MNDPVTFTPAAALRFLKRRRPLRWSFNNWRLGYQFRPVQRCRHCDHTTPYHYQTCIELVEDW